jgi:EmrB/QacA subfamily drug resistance transporter
MLAARIVPLILAVSLFMENMDATVIATSLAAIAADIGSDPIALKLALTSYMVALAIFIPVSSWMADRFGSRNVFRAAIVVFMLGSVACAISGSLLEFVGARFLQGMGGAMMSPIARLFLVRSMPRHQLVDAMAWLTIPAMIGPIVGPPFGGFITTYFSWHWIFLINVPIGIIGIILVGIFLPETQRNAPRAIDFPGFFLAATTFSGWVFGLSVLTLPALPWGYGVAAIVAGTVAGWLYVGHARRTEHPLLDLKLFRHPLFRSAVVTGSLFRVGMGAVPFLFPLMLQLSFGYTPFESGMITFTTAVSALGAKFVAEPMFKRWGFPLTLAGAALGSALCVVFLGIYTPETPLALLITVLLISGFAQSTFWTGSNVFTFADIEDKDAGGANAISQVMVQLSFAIGVAVGGAALEASHHIRGGALDLTDFHIAFFAVSSLVFVSAAMLWRLPRQAGSNLQRQRAAQEKPAE